MKRAAILLVFLAALSASASQPIRGRVRASTGEVLPGVTVFISGTQTSVTTDSDGRFEIIPPAAGGVTLVVFLGGFESREISVTPGSDLDVVLQLAQVSETVTVTATATRDAPMSTFEMRPLDIVRTPGAQADIFQALQQLPGVVKADEGAGLFVRGGDVSETRVLLDGVTIAHPYRYETSAGGQGGAVEPFLLQGIAFSTGGFSARYGNALSAILELRGLGKPAGTAYTATAGLAGLAGRVSMPQGENAGFRASGNLRSTELLFAVNGKPREFNRYPAGWDLNVSGHYESPAAGRFKVFAMEQRTSVGVQLQRESFDGYLNATTRHEVVAASWKGVLGSQWQISSSLGGDAYSNETQAGVIDLRNRDLRVSWRLDLARSIGATIVRLGSDADLARHDVSGITSRLGGDFGGASGTRELDVRYRDTHAGVYGEIEREWRRLTFVVGARADHTSEAGSWIDPRVNVTYAFASKQQLRLAWGIYHQTPSSQYYDRFSGASDLRPMDAQHWIVGYERGDPDQPLHVRIEAYAKDYEHLPIDDPERRFTSEGFGSARGVDTFIRRRWNRFELRGSYSFLDAERRWTPFEQRKRFPLPAEAWRPDFAIRHSTEVSVNVNPTPRLTLGGAFNFASGKPSTPIVGSAEGEFGRLPVYGVINSDQLPPFQRFDVSASYRTTHVGGASRVYFAGITNVFARRNAFEYAYSEDFTEKRPVVSAAPRSVYVGFTITK